MRAFDTTWDYQLNEDMRDRCIDDLDPHELDDLADITYEKTRDMRLEYS